MSSEDNPSDAAGYLWPGADYHAQVERLRTAVGQTIFLAELDATAVQLAVRITDRPYKLLSIMDFPRPDPSTGLAPHMIVLDDGRGVNLGRIARISVNRAFRPDPAEILFQDRAVLQTLLFQDRQLSPQRIAQTSKALLGELLGSPVSSPDARLSGPTTVVERAEETIVPFGHVTSV